LIVDSATNAQNDEWGVICNYQSNAIVKCRRFFLAVFLVFVISWQM